jgi:small-conductance mechanosensitive channel
MNDETDILGFIRIGGMVTGAFVLFGAWMAGRLFVSLSESLGRRFSDRRLQINQTATFVRFTTYILAFLAAVLLSFNLTRELLLAIGGTVAVTLGFALKDLASSVTAGLTIVVDRPFQVGDRVTFGDYHGEVTQIGLRSVRLQTLEDDQVTIPNNKFLTDAVASSNAGELNMMVTMDFYIGADQDVALAKEIVADAITSSRYAFLRKKWTVLVSQVVHESYFAIRLRAKVYVLDVKFEKALESEVTERIIEAFRRADILPPALLHRSLDAPSAPAESTEAAA